MMLTRNSDGSYSAAQIGALRPIVADANTRHGALLKCAEAVHEQEAEEYAMEQSMSHLADVSYGEGAHGEDLG